MTSPEIISSSFVYRKSFVSDVNFGVVLVVAIGSLVLMDVGKKPSSNHPPEMSLVMSLKRID